MATIPQKEPDFVTAGDTVSWQRSLPDYPASAGWVLSYALRGPSAIDITADTNQTINVSSGTSANWAPGSYFIQGVVTLNGERHTVYQDRITIKPNLAAAGANYDGRSHAKRVLDTIEAVIEGRASKTDLQMEIEGTKISRMTHEQLLSLRTYYRNEYRAELRREKVASGKGSGRRILVRF